MAVAFVDAGAAAYHGGTGVTLNVPTVLDGDLLIALVGGMGSTAITAPAGWTTIDDGSAATTFRWVAMFWRVASSEPSTYAFTGSAFDTAGAILGYRAYDASVVDVYALGGLDAGGTSETFPSVTTTVDHDALILALWNDADRFATASTPSGMTARASINTDTDGNDFYTWDNLDAGTAGVVGPFTSTTPSAAWGSATLAIKTGSSGGTPPTPASATGSLTLSGSATARPSQTAIGSLTLSGTAAAQAEELCTEPLPLVWSGYIPQTTGSVPDSGTDDTTSNNDGFRFPLQWSAVVESLVDPVGTFVETSTSIPRISIAMAAPTLVNGVPAQPWTHTDTREDWGHLHLTVNGHSRTVNRGLRFVPLQDAQTEPFGDAEASFRLPGITEFDDPDTFHLRALSAVRLWRRDPDGVDHTLYEGCLASIEPDAVQDDETTQGVVIQCIGALYRLDLLKKPPALVVDAIDYGKRIARVINARRHAYSLNIGHCHEVATGIEGRGPDAFSPVLTGTIQEYLSEMTSDNGDEWTLTLVRPRTPKLVVKDTTTTHFTVTYGQPGVVCRLAKDFTVATTAVYGSGTDGHDAWMGAVFPNIVGGTTPAFPPGVGGTFVAGDNQSGFAEFAAFLRRGHYGPIASDDTYLARDVDNVKDFQDDAGVTIDGIVGAQTWEAAFAPGANQGSLHGAHVNALYAKSATRRYLYNAQGARAGHNPDFDPRVPRVEDYIPFGDGVSKQVGRRSARQIVSRAYPAGRAGEIILTADPEEGSRFDLQAGQNIAVKHYNGATVLLHITRRERDWTTGSVTLTVDEKANDALTAGAIAARNKDLADLTRRPRGFGKRRSKVFNDYGAWLSEDGAGHIPLMYQQAGRWNTQRVPAAPSGTIEAIRLAIGDGLTEHLLNRSLDDANPDPIPGAARAALLITGRPIHPRAIDRMSGMATPLTNLPDGTNPWDRHANVLTRRFDMVYAAGGPGAALGFSPYTDPGDGTDTNLTGLFVDAGSVTYGPTEHFWLWVSIWTPTDTKVGGRLYPGAP